MGSRIIRAFNKSSDYVYKQVPHFSCLDGIKFPLLDDYLEKNKLDLRKVKEKEAKIAIEQQYNEFYTWFTSPDEYRKFLAPVVDTSYDRKTGLPLLVFPKFSPLVNEVNVDAHNEMENFIICGMNANEMNIDKDLLINFFRDLPSVCDYLELNEEDIINHPSNIGYNATFGLRIIDYGLKG